MKHIIQMGKKVLRNIAEEVPHNEITSVRIQSIIQNMNDVLATQNDGVALAAPQIGESYRIFTVAPFIFDDPSDEHLIYINPKIIEQSEKKKWLHEGCLSCRWKVGDVERSVTATVHAYDEYGKEFTQTGDGLLAHIFQHEIDHLDGILFIDKAQNIRDMTEEEINDVLEGTNEQRHV
ncbi:peptide deformylase [Patescibacteria group bacterium]|nr:peptide deformylase [Patescibacteria group bacterium]